jgi:uncharacterized membrane protein
MENQTSSPDIAGGIQVRKVLSINKTPEELYAFWRSFENFPSFMDAVESVDAVDAKRSHWKVKGPAGRTVEWNAEVTEDEPGHLIAWQTTQEADVKNAGVVMFMPGRPERGTEVLVEMSYLPSAGKIGDWLAKLFGRDPSQQLTRDLHRMKALLETGEVPTAERNVARETAHAQ